MKTKILLLAALLGISSVSMAQSVSDGSINYTVVASNTVSQGTSTIMMTDASNGAVTVTTSGAVKNVTLKATGLVSNSVSSINVASWNASDMSSRGNVWTLDVDADDNLVESGISHAAYEALLSSISDANLKKGSELTGQDLDDFDFEPNYYYYYTGIKSGRKTVYGYKMIYAINVTESANVNYIPQSFTAGMLASATNLKTITVSGNAANYFEVEDNYLYNAGKTTLYAATKDAKSATLDQATATISNNALALVSNVTLTSPRTSVSYSTLGGSNNKVVVASATLAQSVTADGKGVKVTGVVTSTNIGTLNISGKRYADFTGATVMGAIKVTAASNFIYYFPADADVKNTDNSNTNIVIGGVCENFVINDDATEIYIPARFTATVATVNRNFTAGKYASIVLPFSLDGTTGETFFQKILPATFTNYNTTEKTVRFTFSRGSLSANVPYLAQVNASATSISTDSPVTVTTTVGANRTNVSAGAYMTGLYAKKTSFGTDDYIFNTKADICYPGTSAVNPIRAYIHLDGFGSTSSSKVIFLDEEGNEADEINVTEIDEVAKSAEVVEKKFYTIDGTEVASPVKGLNIVKTTLSDGTVQTTKIMVK